MAGAGGVVRRHGCGHGWGHGWGHRRTHRAAPAAGAGRRRGRRQRRGCRRARRLRAHRRHRRHRRPHHRPAGDRDVDGHGWLPGDAGSAFWLGRAAVQAALAALAAIEGHREPTALLAAVTAALLPEAPADGLRNAIIVAAHAEPRLR